MKSLPDISTTQFRCVLRSRIPCALPASQYGNYRYLDDLIEDLMRENVDPARIIHAEFLNPKGQWQSYTQPEIQAAVRRVISGGAA